MKFNGWCISYIGHQNEVQAGWYQNGQKHGNWLSIDGYDMQLRESGWYQNNQRVGDMKNHEVYRNFKIEDIFIQKSFQE